MTTDADLKTYHMSITGELKSAQNRVRNLIGQSHWLSDGEHKEAILRRILRNHVPETVRVGRGFVCFNRGRSSNQLDILITDKNKPTLFKDDEFTIVTPDAVRAIIEVKTGIDNFADLKTEMSKLADNAEKIRRSNGGRPIWIGFFSYEEDLSTRDRILKTIQEVSQSKRERVINFVAFGPTMFARYYEEGNFEDGIIGSCWYIYDLPDLAQPYFISNMVWRLTEDSYREMKYAWFPLKKNERDHKKYHVLLETGQLIAFGTR